ncbi:hypothetical protein B0T10DRAFT_29486 [Thelonectria olida]|uniref:Uncharacterized protein n=1 Tax=Thelonectria olida TaxID=1576542 RepID=A0A9P9AX54_9HYPO|nr:hypothetical protein B0T10DRAFT_29486 [Thelonectria olida]
MERSRRTNSRRRTLGGSTSPTSPSEASFDLNSSTSPVATHINNTPQSAHNAAGRRASKPLQQRAFTFSPPTASRSLNSMKRPAAMDNYAFADEEDDGPKKGGHSLRKKARVDYTFEHIDDEVIVPNSSSSARGRKRKSNVNFDTEDIYSQEAKRRGTSMGADTPSARRRNPSRKSSEMKAYREAALEDDDNDVQDTIEVGVSYSEVDESEFPNTSWSNPSSPQSTKATPRVNLAAPPSDTHTETRPIIKLRQSSVSDFFTKTSKDPPGKVTPAPAEQPQDQPAQVKPEQDVYAPEPLSLVAVPTNGSATSSAITPTAVTPTAAPVEKPVVESSPKPLENPVNGDSTSTSEETVLENPNEPASDAKINKEAEAHGETNTTEEAKTEAVVEAGAEAINGTQPSSPQLSSPKMDADPVDEPTKDTEIAKPVVEPQQSEQDDSKSVASEPTSEHPRPSITNAENTIPSSELKEGTNGDEQLTTPANERRTPDSCHSTMDDANAIVNNEAPEPLSTPAEVNVPTPSTPVESQTSAPSSSHPEPKSSPQKPASPEPQMAAEKPQPAPVGRWAHLTPYENDYVLYPEKKGRNDEDTGIEDQTPDREGLDMEPMVEDNDDNADAAPPEAPTPAINTPTRGSPIPDSADPTAFNSPAPAGEDPDDAEVESQDASEKERFYRYRKIRDAEEFVAAVENYENMSTAELTDALEAINVSLVQWQTEWVGLGKVVDDYENSLRRRAADSKYEARTRNLHQHGVNYEEPDFAVKGYKAREKESMNETRYLQKQDRIMAATYGFEYDPHPSKIGRQNPETQQSGIMTRGRSLRNQPRQTAKATETEEVTGKRQRKPVQLFDPAMQDVSRSSTPVPTRGRRRKGGMADGEDTQSNPATSFNTDVASDPEASAPKTRRRRGPRAKADVPSIVEEMVQDQDADESTAANDQATKPTRRGRGRPSVRYEEADPNEFVEEEPQPEPKPPVRRHLLTLKIPKGKNFSEPASSITDNGDSRPSTADSEESSHTAESSYSFRPKRQKRFRDDPDGAEEVAQAPPKKRGKRTKMAVLEVPAATPIAPTPEPVQPTPNRKVHKIKVVRSEARNGTAAPPPVPAPTTSEEQGEEPQKDYKSMTKSEKMSASMKNRWANGNMAGAVEKRKATLAAKKAAQAAAEQKSGVIAPKPKGKAAAKKEAAFQMHLQQPPQLPQQPMQQHPQHPQHQMQFQQHPQQPHQQPPQHPMHQGGNPGYVPGMPGMGYPYPSQR